MTTRTNDEVRAEVSKSYGKRVEGVLNRDELIELVSPGAVSCCGPSDGSGSDCCGTGSASEGQVSRIAQLYQDTETSDLPATVTDVAFGCGNPTAIAALQPGQVVLDLGSGGGIDCFLAAKMVGETGKVYGVDMTPEMIALARKNAAKVGASNVEFRLGEIEHLPIGDASVDVIISNCVINLSPEKEQVFAEAFRVLKPGGRLQVSDIVWTKPVPDAIKNDMEEWAGCIAGALVEGDYLAKIRAAGFQDVQSTRSEYAGREGIASAAVVAVKPGVAAACCGPDCC
jgi:arsenite methyltransferase